MVVAGATNLGGKIIKALLTSEVRAIVRLETDKKN
jgi:hypothetical protein